MSIKIKEKSVIQTCIDKSKWINYAITAKEELLFAIYFANHVPIVVPEMDKLRRSAEETWNDRIDGWKKDIARFLSKPFESRGIKIEDKYWFSTADLVSGFVFLYKHDPIVSEEFFKESLPDFVLFLTDFNDHFDGTPIKSGNIKPYDDVKHNIMQNIKEPGFIPGVWNKSEIIVWYKRKNKSNGKESN